MEEKEGGREGRGVPKHNVRNILTSFRDNDRRRYGLPVIMLERKGMSRSNVVVLFTLLVDVSVAFCQTRFQRIGEVFQLVCLHADDQIDIVFRDGGCRGEDVCGKRTG